MQKNSFLKKEFMEVQNEMCIEPKSENIRSLRFSIHSSSNFKQLSADDACDSYSDDSDFVLPNEKVNRQATLNHISWNSDAQNLELNAEETKMPSWDKSQRRWRKQDDKIAFRMLSDEADTVGISIDNLFKRVSFLFV